MSNTLYRILPISSSYVHPAAKPQELQAVKEPLVFLENFINGLNDSKSKKEVYHSKLEDKQLFLDNITKEDLTYEQRQQKIIKKKLKTKKIISAKKKRELQLLNIPKDQQKYSLYEPLHDLWKKYVLQLADKTK
jgi:hypothetical protein